MTKFGVNGFTGSLRQEVTKKHVRIGVLEPGAVATELISHNNEKVRNDLAASDADAIRAWVDCRGASPWLWRPASLRGCGL